MSPEKPPEPDRGLPVEEADRLTYETMRRDGKFVPQSPEEVARAESEINESAVELPPGLRDPLALLARPAVAESAPETPPLAPDPVTRATSPADHAPTVLASVRT